MLSKLSQMRPRHGLVWIVALTTFLHGAAINGYAAPRPAKAIGSFEEATIGVNVEERAASPVLQPRDIDHHDFQKLVTEGRTISELMRATIEQADHIMHGHSQSHFTHYHDLEEYGWVNHKWDDGEHFYHEYAHDVGASTHESVNADRRIVHTGKWKNPENGRIEWPSHAFFENVYNAINLVLYVVDIVAPLVMVENDPDLTAPPLKHWSDVSYLEWERKQGDKDRVHAPEYIMVSSKANEHTKDVLKYIKRTKHITHWGDLPGGVEFRRDDEAYFALLATPVVYDSAYFLLQHKAQMGIHDIEWVKVFGTGSETNMLLKVVEHQNQVEKVTSIRASISSAPTNIIHYNSSSSYSKL